MASLDSTEGEEYTERLQRLGTPLWKRVLDVQRPYRWNIRRLFGDREVLDVGCGIGRCLSHLAPRGVGVDHNPHSVALCRSNGLTAFTTEEFGESEYAKPGRFGGMLAAHLVEHMPHADAIKILQGYLDYLAPDARLVLICPQERGYRSDSTHVEFADFDALTDVAHQLGFTRTRRQSFPLPRPAGKVFLYNEFVLVADRSA
ncbi:class I SAM-dependent methyltransferase [Actinophytocola gossypii]|uniref:Methyltransferase domain-containing protein n=1 Tax=Actinophytocola gossypii TaxID=2812003 RepID=A0ABT2JFQ5_9PSEU|nr:class I SAM-dependent methyltransferase [Actinophytocola gossypii]MCT2586693.1 methyltransferase domain-containing protein [Actinophytocola gossypii]